MSAMVNDTVYIGGFSYEVGEHEYDLERLRSIRDKPAQIKKLREAGFSKFRASRLTIFDLAGKAMDKLFDKVPVARGDVDGLIFTTSSLGAIDNLSHLQLCHFLLDNRLVNAFPMVSSFSFCGNFMTAVQKGYYAIRSGEYKNIMVVTTDVISPESTRVAPPDIAIGSDGAAACLLSASNFSGYELRGLHQAVNVLSGLLDPDKDFLNYARSVGQGIRTAAAKTFAGNEESRKGVARVFTNNYGYNICKSYLRLIRIDERKAYLDNIGRYGHVCAADLCVNLCDFFESDDRSEEDQEFLLLSTGPFMWGSALITAVKN